MTEFPNIKALSDDQQTILLAAVDSLLTNNPELPKQLTKLASIKKATPLIWKMVLNKLGA
jgi:hypothetical protein